MPNVDKYTLKQVQQYISNSSIWSWLSNYIINNRCPNLPLYDILNKKVSQENVIFEGPMEIRTEHLESRAGPGKKYHEEEVVWESRISQILNLSCSPQMLPPLIVYLAKRAAPHSCCTYKAVVADGAHRLESFKRAGYKNVYAIFWFNSPQEHEIFMREYQNKAYTKIL